MYSVFRARTQCHTEAYVTVQHLRKQRPASCQSCDSEGVYWWKKTGVAAEHWKGDAGSVTDGQRPAVGANVEVKRPSGRDDPG